MFVVVHSGHVIRCRTPGTASYGSYCVYLSCRVVSVCSVVNRTPGAVWECIPTDVLAGIAEHWQQPRNGDGQVCKSPLDTVCPQTLSCLCCALFIFDCRNASAYCSALYTAPLLRESNIAEDERANLHYLGIKWQNAQYLLAYHRMLQC